VRSRDVLALMLALMMMAPGVGWAQPPGPTPAAQAPRTGARGLRILVLEGQDAVNSLPTRAAASPAVQVFDYMGEPVEGAEVTFEAPASGAGGLFDNQKTSFKTRTDPRGQAVTSFAPNTLPGTFAIRVVAKFGDETAEATITQTNSAKTTGVEYKPPTHPWYKDWKWLTLMAVGAGAGGYAIYWGVTRSSNPTITLTPGSVTIGGPR
jgi:hypothetical protein